MNEKLGQKAWFTSQCKEIFDRHVPQKGPDFPGLDEHQIEADNESNDSDDGEKQEEAILGKLVKVCPTMFFNTFGISEKRIRTDTQFGNRYWRSFA